MTHRVVFTQEAEAQLAELYKYICAANSPANALRFTSSVFAYCERLKIYPRRGTKRDDLRPGLRTVGYRRRVTIAFAVDEHVVTIVGVFYGGQNFEAALRAPTERS